MAFGRINKAKELPPHRHRPGKMPMAGHLKIGELVNSAKGPRPTSLDYFRVDKYADAFAKTYGDKPTSVELCFFTDDIVESCYERYEYWNGKLQVAYSNGEVAWVRGPDNQFHERVLSESPEKGRSVSEEMIFGMKKDDEKVEKFHMLTLRFMLYRVSVFGYWELSTKATETSIPNLISTVDSVREAAGRLSFVPFRLSVERKSSQYLDGNEKKTRNFSSLSIVPELDQKALEYIANHLSEVYNPKSVGLGGTVLTRELVLEHEEKTQKLIGLSGEA